MRSRYYIFFKICLLLEGSISKWFMTTNSPLISLSLCVSEIHPPQFVEQRRTLWRSSARQKNLRRPFFRSVCPRLVDYFSKPTEVRGPFQDSFFFFSEFKNLFSVKTTDLLFLPLQIFFEMFRNNNYLATYFKVSTLVPI